LAGPPTRLVALLEVMLCSGFPTQILVLSALVAAGLVPTTAGDGLSLPAVTTLLSLDALLLVTLILVFLRRHGERPRSVFLGTRRLLREALLGLVLTLPVLMAASGLVAGLRAAWPWLQTVQENPLARLLETPRDAWVFGTVAVLAGGVREELQRAFVLHRFGQRLGGPLVGLVVFSAVFGAGHTMQGIDVAVTTAVLGATWGALYLWRRSVVAPVVCHAAFNALEVLHYRLLP
jgi:membrane protease YdiL (CAAX protease family)